MKKKIKYKNIIHQMHGWAPVVHATATATDTHTHLWAEQSFRHNISHQFAHIIQFHEHAAIVVARLNRIVLRSIPIAFAFITKMMQKS